MWSHRTLSMNSQNSMISIFQNFVIQTITVVALIVTVVLTTVALCKCKQQKKKNATNELIRVIVTMLQHAAVSDLTIEEEKGVTA